MWTYLGSKANIVEYYPKPTHDIIIEPFAGTARYSLRYFEKDVLLIDKYETIINIWKWLQKCSKQDIQRLPHKVKPGQLLSDFTFDCDEARDLTGFIIGYGMERPRKTASAKRMIARPNHINNCLQQIVANLHKIKHWTIRCDDYQSAPNIPATWFIDPPYQVGGKYYIHNKIDYDHLANWCRSREGQVMVCEDTRARWLPFIRIATQKGAKGMKHEAIWANFATEYHKIATLFKI